MIKIYHTPKTRSLRVLWMLEEMGLDYKVVPIDFRGEKPEDFLAANPAGTLPAMVDGKAVITESVAILQYLGDRYGPTPLIVKPDSPDYPAYLQFMYLGEGGLSAPLNAVVGTRFFGPDDQQSNFTIEVVRTGFFNRLKHVERRLQKSQWLAGDHFTAADISVQWALGIGDWVLNAGDKISPEVRAWSDRCTARPAYERAAAK